MKCDYCNKELPETVGGRRNICKCEKAQREWSLCMSISQLKKELSQLNKELSDLKDEK